MKALTKKETRLRAQLAREVALEKAKNEWRKDALQVLADTASVILGAPGPALPLGEDVWFTTSVSDARRALGADAMAKGKHPVNALSALKISKLSAPGRYADGNCLYMVVDRSGAKRWVLRVVVQGRRRDMGLGGVKIASLAHARDAAQWYRAIARSGGDPFKVRRHEGRDPRSTLVKELGLMRFLYTRRDTSLRVKATTISTRESLTKGRR